MRSLSKKTSFFLILFLTNALADNTDIDSTNHQQMKVSSSAEAQRIDAKQQRGLESISQAIDALLQAFHNIATETGNIDQIAPVEHKVATDKARAKEHYQRKDYQTGHDILEGTYATVKMAIIQLREGSTLIKSRAAADQYDIKSSASKEVKDHDKLVASIDALVIAYKRISAEKGQAEQAAIMQGNIATLKLKAEKQNLSGDYSKGNYLLNAAYILIKGAVDSLREGDTLIQSLDFATHQEEYQYYVRKTQSQKMAIKIIQENSADDSKDIFLNRLLVSTQNMLEQASALVEKNNFEAAIPVMDKAFTRLQSGLMMSLSSR